MDIQVSSNFERQLFESVGRDSDAIKNLFKEFAEHNSYTLDANILDDLQSVLNHIEQSTSGTESEDVEVLV